MKENKAIQLAVTFTLVMAAVAIALLVLALVPQSNAGHEVTIRPSDWTNQTLVPWSTLDPETSAIK